MSKHDLTADTLNDIYRQLYPDTKMKAQLSAAQERIEDMHLQILDLNESRHDLIQKADNLAKEVKEYRLAASAHRIAREHADGAQARCTQMESDVKRLTEDLSTLQKNYNHVFELQKAKDSTIREAMRIVEEMRDKVKKSDEYKKDADKYKDQAEHLARQTIRLTDEKRKLIEDVEKLRTDYVSLMASFKEIKDQVPDLIEENNKFREQTVRLVNEKASTTCEGSKNGNPKSSCGVCAACKLQQTQSILNQTVINFEAGRRIHQRPSTPEQCTRHTTTLLPQGPQRRGRLFHVEWQKNRPRRASTREKRIGPQVRKAYVYSPLLHRDGDFTRRIHQV
jgi:DNA repair exonuclease SbcCD ATPase subunit